MLQLWNLKKCLIGLIENYYGINFKGTQHVSTKMVKKLKPMYTSVQSCVKMPTGITGYFNCPAGVKQECIPSL